jgi:glycosyltransferase involved in cell wall biosynthesis
MSFKKHNTSFCIVCRNSLLALKKTLLQNLQNDQYDGVEFIVVDYNSTDGTDYWIHENLNDFVLSGKLKYYKTFEPVAWDESHAKNIAIRLAINDYMCFISSEEELEKLCLLKADLLKIRGFNEQITDSDIQYIDLLNRLNNSNAKHAGTKIISTAIKTVDTVYSSTVFKLFIRHISHTASELIILYDNQQYYRGTLINLLNKNAEKSKQAYNETEQMSEYTIAEPGWEKGTWRKTNNETIHFVPRNGNEYALLKSHGQYAFLIDINNDMFYAAQDDELLQAIIEFKDTLYDELIMQKNYADRITVANTEGFGCATVFKNFEWQQPIILQ